MSEVESLRRLLKRIDKLNKGMAELFAEEEKALTDYFPGKDCMCAASSAGECGCSGVDWTPTEIYELRNAIASYVRKIDKIINPEPAAQDGKEPVGEQVMPRVKGKPFRCDCGANVFTVIGKLRYRCNGCGDHYVGETS